MDMSWMMGGGNFGVGAQMGGYGGGNLYGGGVPQQQQQIPMQQQFQQFQQPSGKDGGKGGKGKGKDSWGGGGGAAKGGGKFGGNFGGASPGKGKGKDAFAGAGAWKGGAKGGDEGKGGAKGGKGKVFQKIQSGEPCYVGRLRNFHTEKKAGFISSPEAYQACGQEVYAYKAVLEQAKMGVGDTCIFFVHWSQWGQPQASYEMIRIHSAHGHTLKGTFKMGNSPDKGFGFIECPAAKEYFNRDIYVNREQAMGLQQGQWVSFNIKLNKDMNPNAEDLAICDENWEPSAGDLETSNEAADVPASWDMRGWWDTGKRGGKPTMTGELYVAVIKSYSETNGWGFVSSQELMAKYSTDVFIHSREMFNVQNKSVGELIQFELAVNHDGKLQAVRAEPAKGPVPTMKAVGPETAAGEPAAKKPRLEGEMPSAETAEAVAA